MKRKYVTLCIMISSPRQLGNNIVIYLSPLIDNLNMFWQTLVNVFDTYCEDNFSLYMMLFFTIDDFSIYGNFNGFNVNSHYACPICQK